MLFHSSCFYHHHPFPPLLTAISYLVGTREADMKLATCGKRRSFSDKTERFLEEGKDLSENGEISNFAILSQLFLDFII
jgi:hypothetical protein